MNKSSGGKKITVKCKGCGGYCKTDKDDWSKGLWMGKMRFTLNFIHSCGWKEKIIL